MRRVARRVGMVVAVLGLVLGVADHARAALVLFTDRTAWETAVGSFSTENFNSIVSDTVFTDSTLAFPDLTLRSTGGALGDVLVDVQPYEFNPGTADIDGTARLNLGGLGASSVVSIEFDSPVSAAGFDTANYDVINDRAQAFVGATLIGTFPALRGQTGFIGVLDTAGATITDIDFIRSPGAANETFNAFDNVSFAAGPTVVPYPPTLVMGGIAALLSLGFARRRRR